MNNHQTRTNQYPHLKKFFNLCWAYFSADLKNREELVEVIRDSERELPD